MPTYTIEYYTSDDNTSETLSSIEESFDNIEQGIEYILKESGIINKNGVLISEVYHNEPDRAQILLETKYFDKNGNEKTKRINEDKDHSVNYMAEIELIQENDNDQVSTD